MAGGGPVGVNGAGMPAAAARPLGDGARWSSRSALGPSAPALATLAAGSAGGVRGTEDRTHSGVPGGGPAGVHGAGPPAAAARLAGDGDADRERGGGVPGSGPAGVNGAGAPAAVPLVGDGDADSERGGGVPGGGPAGVNGAGPPPRGGGIGPRGVDGERGNADRERGAVACGGPPLQWPHWTRADAEKAALAQPRRLTLHTLWA